MFALFFPGIEMVVRFAATKQNGQPASAGGGEEEEEKDEREEEEEEEAIDGGIGSSGGDKFPFTLAEVAGSFLLRGRGLESVSQR